jgi:L-ascorbate metabolism protein UlaG (beta-lactamase superfamily)
MKVTFVGHASVICEVGDVRLWSDPWLNGEAFNESWSLFPSPVLRSGKERWSLCFKSTMILR